MQPRGLTAAPRALPYARLSAALRLALAILEARREAETAGAGAHASVQVQAHAHAGAVQWTAEQRAVIGTDLKKGEVSTGGGGIDPFNFNSKQALTVNHPTHKRTHTCTPRLHLPSPRC